MKQIYLFVIAFFVLQKVFSQTDSLKYILKSNLTSRQKAQALLAMLSNQRPSEIAIEASKIALIESQKAGDLQLESQVLVQLGIFYEKQENFREAMIYYAEGLKKSEKINFQLGLARAHLGMGVVYSFWDDYLNSQPHLHKSINIFESQKNYSKEFFKALNHLATNYQETQNYEKAEKYFTDIITLAEKSKDSLSLSVAYANLGQLYKIQNDTTASKSYTQKAFQIATTIRDSLGMAVYYNHMGEYYFTENNLQRAESFFEKGLSIANQLHNYEWSAYSLANLAKIYVKYGKKTEAVLLFGKAISNYQRLGIKKELAECYRQIYHLYKEMDAYEQALEYHELLKKTNDSILDEARNRQIQEVSAKYDLEGKNREIEDLEDQKSETENLTWSFLLISTLSILLLFLTWRKFQDRKRVNAELQEKNLIIEQRNRSLLESENNLKEALATKDKFFSIIAHDLRSPLNSLTGFLSLLIEHTDSFSKEEIIDVAQKTDNSVKNLRNLLDNLLQWALSQTQGIEFNPSMISLPELIHENKDLLNDLAQNKGLQITYHIEGEALAFADRNMVLLVLRNLIANAIKFTPRGGKIHIYVSPKPHTQEVCIIDSGQGMDENTIAKLFTKQISSTSGTENEKGTGLGLLLCKDFIEKNNGKIWVESIPQKGSKFCFTLPANES